MHTLAFLLLLLVVYATPSASQACPFGAAFCNGRHGAGCYDPIYTACHDGLICPNVTSPCLGRYGAGCYNPAYATCYKAWYVRRPCSRVSDHMACGAMTPAELHVQQATCDPTQGDESSTRPVMEVLPPSK